MGTVGDCFDNAIMEAFWARMQIELLDRQRWRTRIELANVIFEYLEIFHNRHRRHTALRMRTPIEYETNHYNTQTVKPLIQVTDAFVGSVKRPRNMVTARAHSSGLSLGKEAMDMAGESTGQDTGSWTWRPPVFDP